MAEHLYYETRYVCFLDILGFRTHVGRSVRDAAGAELLHKVMAAAAYVADKAASWPAEEFTAFSDSLLISNVELAPLCDLVGGLWRIYAADGFFLRGGLAKGLAVHRESLAYGPAIIDAYEIESGVSKVPRVVVAPSVVEEIRSGEARRDELEAFRQNVLRKLLVEDSDGMIFLDTFEAFSTVERVPEMPDEIRSAREQIENGLRENQRDLGVLSKYLWLAKRYNAFRERKGRFSEPEIKFA